jgi:hypothetical protein
MFNPLQIWNITENLKAKRSSLIFNCPNPALLGHSMVYWDFIGKIASKLSVPKPNPKTVLGQSFFAEKWFGNV